MNGITQHVMPQQQFSPQNMGALMNLMGGSASQQAGPSQISQSFGGFGADPYAGLLGQVANTQSLMAQTMDRAFTMVGKMFDMAMSFMFNAGGQQAGLGQMGMGVSQLPGAIAGIGGSPTGIAGQSAGSSDFLGSAIDIGKKVWDFFQGDTGGAVLDTVKDFGSSIWGGIKDVGSSIWGGVKDFAGSAISGIGSWLGGLF